MENNKLVYGFRAVNSVLSSTPQAIRRIFFSTNRTDKRITDCWRLAKTRGVEVVETEKPKLDKLVRASHQGVIAVVRKLLLKSIDLFNSKLILVLDGVTDQRNIGSCLRIAEATGVEVVIVKGLLRRNGTVEKTASGNCSSIRILEVRNIRNILKLLKLHGFYTVGAVPSAKFTIQSVKLFSPLVLVVGSEEKGISFGVAAECHCLVRVPLRGWCSSLNVSMASGMILYEILNRMLS